ncbi:hypothetical protein F4824DRAFT_270903 [Ustulina deusta]|nr:hypothetical protein F4824DRAFT_270903 [Ustulina deusta]
MAHLLNVPLEVLLQITSHLTTPEYGHLRRSCKQMDALLFGAFAREFFSKRQFALIEFSIQALVDIAKSRLGPSLTHLIIHLEHPHAGASHHSAAEASVQHNQYHAEAVNHWEFITTGLDVEMLSDALAHLPNLETIGMRDFHSSSRCRDGTGWHSYGCPTFVAKTRSSLALPNSPTTINSWRDRGSEYTRHVFLTILRAIGNAAVSGWNPKLTRMEVLLHTCQFRDQSFKIPDRFDAGISLALSKLTAIFLDNLSGEQPLVWVCDVGGETNPIMGIGYFLSRFLAKFSALEHLRLNFQSYRPLSTETFLLWLADARDNSTDPMPKPVDSLASANAAASLPAHFPPAPEFPKLKILEIGMATVQESVLLALYKKYKSTLEGVGLHKITLSCARKTKINPWAQLCNNMAKADLQLRSVGLSYLKQTSATKAGDSTRGGGVTFTVSRNKYVKVWKGSAFTQSVKDITDDMKFQWEDNNSGEDDDESMTDDDD